MKFVNMLEEDLNMANKLKSGAKSVGELVAITFDSPQAKDEFLRKLASAKTKNEVVDLLDGNAAPGRIN